eukprot:ANDGO_06445.mRNA.1 hypothetical protein
MSFSPPRNAATYKQHSRTDNAVYTAREVTEFLVSKEQTSRTSPSSLHQPDVRTASSRSTPVDAGQYAKYVHSAPFDTSVPFQPQPARPSPPEVRNYYTRRPPPPAAASSSLASKANSRQTWSTKDNGSEKKSTAKTAKDGGPVAKQTHLEYLFAGTVSPAAEYEQAHRSTTLVKKRTSPVATTAVEKTSLEWNEAANARVPGQDAHYTKGPFGSYTDTSIRIMHGLPYKHPR